MTTWVKRMRVVGSQGDEYTVGVKDDKTWGCSCPAWKFHSAPKPDCKHIIAVKGAAKAASRVSPTFPVLSGGAPALDMDVGVVIAALPSAARFTNLDYEIIVQ